MMSRSPVAIVIVVLCSLAGLAQGSSAYLVSLERWRADHESALRADDGWLTVVGLGWLKDGANRAGSATDADRLTSGSLSLFVIERGEKFGIKAENPPCAVTEFATCPLPPRQNLLPIRIEAGERYTPHK